MAAISRLGVYIPAGRLTREAIAAAWGTPSVGGERAVAAPDEDSLTMGVEAGQRALAGAGGVDVVDTVFLATTTPPYAEKQVATIAAAALGLSDATRTADFSGSLRCGLSALRAAADAVNAGESRGVLVLVADCRVPAPESTAEQLAGDAAVAVLFCGEGRLATLDAWGMVSEDITARWRAYGDQLVRVFEERLEQGPGFSRLLPQACQRALRTAGIGPAALARVALSGPNPRAPLTAAREAGLPRTAVVTPPWREVGDAGAAGPLLALAAALQGSRPGERLLVGGYGDGAEAVVATRGEEEFTDLRKALGRRRELSSYEEYLAARRLLPSHAEPDELAVSPIAYWRRRQAILGRLGAVCRICGTQQFPPAPTCVSCGTLDALDPVRLADTGTVFTFTNDHLVDGRYVEHPIPRCVIDLDGGARFYTSMTDCDPTQVRVGARVELTFRSRGAAGGFRNYGWKCRPVEV